MLEYRNSPRIGSVLLGLDPTPPLVDTRSCRRPIVVVALVVLYVSRTFDRSPCRARTATGESRRHRPGCSLVLRFLRNAAWGTQRRSNLARFAVPMRPRAHRLPTNISICRQEGPIYRELPKLEVAGSTPVRRLQAPERYLALAAVSSLRLWREAHGQTRTVAGQADTDLQYHCSIGRRFDLQRRPSACTSTTAAVRFVCTGISLVFPSSPSATNCPA
jgi:hypothetical protein